jgi:hypothetical protein
VRRLLQPLGPPMLPTSPHEAAWVFTDRDGTILGLSDAAAELLQMPAATLLRKNLVSFLEGSSKRWHATTRTTGIGPVRHAACLRLPETEKVPVWVILRGLTEQPDSYLIWTFEAMTGAESLSRG